VRPVHLAPAGDDIPLQLRQMDVEFSQCLVFDRPSTLANQVGAGQRLPGLAIAAAKRVAELAQDPLKIGVGQRLARSLEKLVMSMAKVCRVIHRTIIPSRAKCVAGIRGVNTADCRAAYNEVMAADLSSRFPSRALMWKLSTRTLQFGRR